MRTSSSVLLVNRSKLFCEVLKEALEQRGFRVITYYSSGIELMEKIQALDPEIVVISSTIEKFSQLQIVDEMIRLNLNKRILVLSHTDEEIAEMQRRPTIHGHIHAFDGMSEMFFALQEIQAGRSYVSSSIETILNGRIETDISLWSVTSLLESLTPREKEIMQALSNSLTTPQIANKYKLSPATVNNHRANIMQKLKLKGRNQLMSLAVSLKTNLIFSN